MKKLPIYILMFVLMVGVVNAAVYYNYWVEDSTHMWIKFNTTSGTNITFTINNGTNQSGYIESGTYTFPVIFDDFNDASFNSSMWCNYAGGSYSYSETGGILTWTSTGTNGKYLVSCSSVLGGVTRARAFEGYYRWTSTAASSSCGGIINTGYTGWGWVYGYFWDRTSGAYLNSAGAWSNYAFGYANSYDRMSVLYRYDGGWKQEYYRGITTSLFSAAAAPATTQEILIIGILYDNGNYDAYDWVGMRNILNATPTISCSSSGSTTTCNVTPTETGNDVTYVMTGNFNTAGNNKVYTGTESPAYSQTLNTPIDDTIIFITNNTISVNTTSIGLTGTLNTTQYIYYSNGTLYQSKSNASENVTNSFTINATGTYYINATITNTTYNASTSTSTITVYNLTNGSFITPNSASVYELNTSIFINYTSTNSTSTKANISYYNISLMNSNGAFNKTINGNNSANLTYNWSSNGTTAGTYYINVKAIDNLSNTINFTSQLFEITNPSCINMTLTNGLNLSNWQLTRYMKHVERGNISGTKRYYSYYLNGTGILLVNQTNSTFNINLTGTTCNYTIKLLQNLSVSSNGLYTLNLTIGGNSTLLKNTTIYNATINNTVTLANMTLNINNVYIRYYYDTSTNTTTFVNNSDYTINLRVN